MARQTIDHHPESTPNYSPKVLSQSTPPNHSPNPARSHPRDPWGGLNRRYCYKYASKFQCNISVQSLKNSVQSPQNFSAIFQCKLQNNQCKFSVQTPKISVQTPKSGLNTICTRLCWEPMAGILQSHTTDFRSR